MAWVLDLDGVVWLGSEIIEGAAEAVAALQAAGEDVWFVTNASFRPVAAVEQQQILWTQSLEVLEEHLALAFVNTVQGGSQHDFAPREIEAEGDLIGAGGAWHVAGTQPEAHRGGIGGHQAQALPASQRCRPGR